MQFNNTSAQIVEGVPVSPTPVDHGLLTWAFDPAHATNTYTLATGGTMYMVAVKALPRVVSNIVVNMTTAGATLTSGQNFAAIYQNGALIGQTADQSTAWAGSTGVLTMALANPVTPNQGVIYVALVSNGTTKPTFASGAAAAGVNAGLTAANSRFGTANTSITTTLPTTLGTLSALSQSPWVALS